ncbi:MAG TPA: ComEA family DNA-binding protein [Dehalococcoidia bacterium]|nr:ComEA family DNA-binding protein [Dehalococcoidia bacterium]
MPELKQYSWPIAALFAVLALSGLMYVAADRLDDPDPLVVNQGGQPLGEIRVYVVGAVRNPGVYTVREEDRWIDAIEAAGGFSPDANQLAVNLARRVRDEDQITVPILGAGAVAGFSQGPLVNINTASDSELMDLPGIGEERAGRIVQSRAAEGLFAAPDDLVFRGLIPQSVLDEIAPLITTTQ